MYEVDTKYVQKFDYSHFSPITIEQFCTGIISIACEEAKVCTMKKDILNDNDVYCKFVFTFETEDKAFAVLKSIRTLMKSTTECDYNTFYFYDNLYCYSLMLINDTVILEIYDNINLNKIKYSLYKEEEN